MIFCQLILLKLLFSLYTKKKYCMGKSILVKKIENLSMYLSFVDMINYTQHFRFYEQYSF